MFFYLHFPKDLRSTVAVRQTTAVELQAQGTEPGVLYVEAGRQRLLELEGARGRLWLLGDPILTEPCHPDSLMKDGQVDEALLFVRIKGHYYWFWITENALSAGSGLGAVFPVYYHEDPQAVRLSSHSFFLQEQTGPAARNRRNLLERLLFNYPFFDSTWWENIRLLPAHRQWRLSGSGRRIAGRFSIADFFGAPRRHSRRHLRSLAEQFANECRSFLPRDTFGISFTGGFDGRTLLAAARQAGSSFQTYSFGKPGTMDVAFPLAQSRRLGVPYQPVYLDESYLAEHALPSVLAFMQLSEYNGNLGRPHYHYAAEQLSGELDYLVTGNFGSELFRALYLPGVMMSHNLIDLFSAADNAWKDRLVHSAQAWSGLGLEAELDALIADLAGYLDTMRGWEPNQKFYYFVINEIFRKYFGPELIVQSRFLNNRTPFLSLPFIQALNDTIWSSVHSRLFEKQKYRRIKGQYFYAEVLRQSDTQLYRMPTSKGYSPADVGNPLRRPVLLGKIIAKRFSGRREKDENAVNEFFERHHPAVAEALLLREGDFPGAAILKKASEDLAQGSNTAYWIKQYSIFAGWAAAGAKTLTTKL